MLVGFAVFGGDILRHQLQWKAIAKADGRAIRWSGPRDGVIGHPADMLIELRWMRLKAGAEVTDLASTTAEGRASATGHC